MNILDIDAVFFEVWNSRVSYLEFLGTLTGIIAVALSARGNIWSWPLGVVNVTLTFFLFYQVQLYPDMLLQVFFFVTNLVGWWRWAHPAKHEEDAKLELKISWASPGGRSWILLIALIGTALMGLAAARLHEWLPLIFAQPSAMPFADSFITVVSIVATFYMINKKIECWLLWIAVDMLATWVYFARDLRLYSLLYLVYCFLAFYGMLTWMKIFRSYRV